MYDTRETSEQNILVDADAVMHYSVTTLGFQKENIVVVGTR